MRCCFIASINSDGAGGYCTIWVVDALGQVNHSVLYGF